jgi:hypothetical protein
MLLVVIIPSGKYLGLGLLLFPYNFVAGSSSMTYNLFIGKSFLGDNFDILQ